MRRTISLILWVLVALVGAAAYWVLAWNLNEPINSAYILIAAICTYAIGYRFYSKWIAARILALNDRRATPCEVRDDGKDFVKTNKWIVFGHHFAAISGPGPLVGPVLAAQFGYLPGTLWILIGVVLGGAVQDFVILFASIRRDGKSLSQMVREELNTAAGVIGVVAILSIMIILLAVLALVVVNALAESPWGVFTVGATIPIALLMGGYLRWLRPGRVLEASVLGVTLLLLGVVGGQWIASNETLSDLFHLKERALAWSVITYAFAASVLPVWLLLAPRDYLSTFMKLGTILLLALGVLLVLPQLHMAPVTRFIDGSGPVIPGKLFPFCFITIACGAISGFHTLISSGITPKIITRESYSRPIGYGAMCLESLVAIMAMIAACTLEPGVYLAMNVKVPGGDAAAVAAATVAKVNSFGPEFTITTERMSQLARDVQEETLYGRTGGAATLAVGMANLFSRLVGNNWLGIWYHFALMFEALFILTTLDAGTRVGRYLLQDALGHLWKPLGNVRSLPANLVASILVVAAWGYFVIAAIDPNNPDGGIKALWPIFGIANQLLAATALCLATTILLKMQLTGEKGNEGRKLLRRPSFALVTLLPLLWLLSVTGTAAVQKIFHEESDPKRARLGFLQIARETQQRLPALRQNADRLIAALPPEARPDVKIKNPQSPLEKATATAQAARQAVRSAEAQVFNNRLDAAVTGFFLLLVLGIFLISVREWILLLARKKVSVLSETQPTWLPDYAIAEAKPLHVGSLIALTLALVRELSGDASVDRAQQARSYACPKCDPIRLNVSENSKLAENPRSRAYVQAAEERFNGVNRCC
jgi:carbon starvation protein